MTQGPPSTPESSGWVAVRCIFRPELKGTGMDEERITLWRTTSMDEAVQRAEAEAHEYAAALSTPPADPHEYVGLAQDYLLYDTPGDGAEVFSLVRGSDLEPEDYLDAFVDTGAEGQRHIADHDDEESEGSPAGPSGAPGHTCATIPPLVPLHDHADHHMRPPRGRQHP